MELSDSSRTKSTEPPWLSSDEWQAAFDALPEAIFLFDESKRLNRANSAGLRLEQVDARAIEGARCCEMFWHAEEAEECVVDRSVASREVVEVEMLAGEAEDVHTLVTVMPVRDSQGEVTGKTLVIVRDVSDLRRAEAEAFEHKSFMASLADLTPDEIYTLDLEGRFTWMNERAEVSNHLLSASLLGRHFNELVAAESRDAVSLNLARTIEGEDTQCEVQTIRPDGTVRYVEAYTSALWREGEVTGVMVFLRDITERKRAQERMAQSDKLRAVGELAAGVAHNLNNALTVIQGRAQLLQMRATDEATRKSLEVITRAVSDSAQTLRRMLDFARRGSTTDFGPVDLSDLIASSVEIARPKWQSSSATRAGQIEVQVVNQGPVYVYGDAAELREVVLNMIFNAVDAMPEGGVIEMGTRAEIDSACFWVADTGKGMPPEVVERIFEPFYTTKGERGTGLGLSASHGIVARHNGQIMVVSFPGEGTRFEVRLPLFEEARRAKQENTSVPAVLVEPARVLVVEDEERVRSLLSETFEAAGHTVVQASDGAVALKRLEEEEFELVISDIGLPEVSGLQVARWIKTNRPALPVILATGWIEMITPADYEQGRIDAVFKKPYAVKEILERASELLNAVREEKSKTEVLHR
jgi:PAS domain S-box-containing protein